MDQRKYLIEGKISQKKFSEVYHQNKTRLAEVEREEATLKERLEKKKGTKKYKLINFLSKKKDWTLFIITLLVISFLLSTCMWRKVLNLVITLLVFLVIALALYLLTTWMLRKKRKKINKRKFWNRHKYKR